MHTIFEQKYLKPAIVNEPFIYYIQGVSSGFDIMYLALADRNIQVRFGLKVVWESWVGGI
jgi:hypothetical protein